MSNLAPTNIPPGGTIPTHGATRVILDRNDKPKFVSTKLTDARMAICRGLAEYVEQLHSIGPEGNEIRFAKVLPYWPDWERVAAYPAASIYSEEKGKYDASHLTPSEPNLENQTPDGLFIVQTSEFVLPGLKLDCWCTELPQRWAFAAMLEDALSPVDFMYGLRLELPHYFNARAEFEPTDSTYLDDEISSGKRYRRVIFEMTARVPVLRATAYPTLKQTRIQLTVGTGASSVIPAKPKPVFSSR